MRLPCDNLGPLLPECVCGGFIRVARERTHPNALSQKMPRGGSALVPRGSGDQDQSVMMSVAHPSPRVEMYKNQHPSLAASLLGNGCPVNPAPARACPDHSSISELRIPEKSLSFTRVLRKGHGSASIPRHPTSEYPQGPPQAISAAIHPRKT